MEYSSFFNSKNGDRKYKAEDWDRHLKDLISNGVFLRDSASLQVTADGSDMTVTVLLGAAWINGKHYLSDQAIVLSIDVADGVLDRIDRIVLQCSTADRLITVKVKKGAPAGTAVAPDLQRDADAYELGLAAVEINAGMIAIRQADITDTRLDTSVCGAVVGLITQVGTDTLYAQIQDDLRHFRSDRESDFSTWSTAQKAAFAAWRGEESDSFAAWFDSVKGQLSSDAAGQLLNNINAHISNTTVHITADERSKWSAKANAYVFTVTLSASDWTDSAPYTQTVTVDGITAAMDPHLYLAPATVGAPTEAEEDAVACITGGTTADGSVTVICRDDKPTTDITVRLEVTM